MAGLEQESSAGAVGGGLDECDLVTEEAEYEGYLEVRKVEVSARIECVRSLYCCSAWIINYWSGSTLVAHSLLPSPLPPSLSQCQARGLQCHGITEAAVLDISSSQLLRQKKTLFPSRLHRKEGLNLLI